MSSLHEIKSRIKSVKDTQKITNAMYLIASMKMRKAKQELDHTRPYFEAVAGEIKRIFRISDRIESHYFFPPEEQESLEGVFGMLVISADKGLAGAYNQNVLKKAEEMLQRHPDTKLYVVGEYGRQYFMRRQIHVEQNFLYTAQNPTIRRAREISSVLLEAFDEGKIRQLYVLYTDLKNAVQTEAKLTRILPFHRSAFGSPASEKKVRHPFEFVPSLREVLNALIPGYVSGFIYSALVDSFCSEQNARMMAMQSANDNAEEVLQELRSAFNKQRQDAITQEIIEVSSPRAAK